MVNLPPAAGVESEPPCPAEFAIFFKSHYRQVVGAVICLGATEHEAQEATQEAMLKVLIHWKKIDNPVPYACRCAMRFFFKDRQRQARAPLVGLEDGGQDAHSDVRLTVWEDRQWVDHVLKTLPPGQRLVMALVVDEFTPMEIAAMLGKTPEAVRQTLCSARKRLKATLHEEGGETQ